VAGGRMAVGGLRCSH